MRVESVRTKPEQTNPIQVMRIRAVVVALAVPFIFLLLVAAAYG
jgi:hypothetical protein